MKIFFVYLVLVLQDFDVCSYELSADERILQCNDWEDTSAPKTTVQLDQGDQNYYICLHTCWNLGYYYMAIKPGCTNTECVCLEHQPSVMRKCDQQLFDDCDNRKSIPLYYSVVSHEDHSLMGCMPDSDVDSQLSKYKESYVTTVSQCLEQCSKNQPSGEDIKKVLAGITSGCDRVGKCGEELKCSCITTSPSVSMMQQDCSESCKAGFTRCRKARFTALYFTNKALHEEASSTTLSTRSIVMISVFTSILVILILIFIAFVIRSKFQEKHLPFKSSRLAKPVDDSGVYKANSSPSGLTTNHISHPSPSMDSPRPNRAAPAPPPPPVSNKPYMPDYQNPHTPPSASSSITPLIKSSPVPKQHYDDAGYVSPTIIKTNKFSSPNQGGHGRSSDPPKGFHDNYILDNDSRSSSVSSFSSIKALFDTPKTGTPVFKPSPLATGGNRGSKPSPLLSKQAHHNSISTPYPSKPTQRSPCYMNTDGFF